MVTVCFQFDNFADFAAPPPHAQPLRGALCDVVAAPKNSAKLLTISHVMVKYKVTTHTLKGG